MSPAPSVLRVLVAHPKDLGSLTVRRALPAVAQRQLSGWTFLDHMGPADIPPGSPLTVRPHPHIGLATVTYLYAGEIVHRDSLGYEQAIRPGDVNWMTAGRGIVHSERSSPEITRTGQRIHGLQLWVALPKEHEETDPRFVHYPGASLPEQTVDGVRVRVLAGAAYGLTSPVRVLSPLFYVDVTMGGGTSLPLPAGYEERGVYVAEGEVEIDGQRVETGSLAVIVPGAEGVVRSAGGARLAILGGAPLDGKRFLFWNYVSSRPERVEQAHRDWAEGRFPKVPGDDVEFIPAPAEGPRFTHEG